MICFRVFSYTFIFCLLLAALSACTSDSTRVAKGMPNSITKRDTVESKPVEAPKPVFQFHFISLRNKNKAIRDSGLAMMKALTRGERDIVLRLNRVDAASYRGLDTMIVPDKIDTNWMAYSIYPLELPMLKDVRKMVFFA